MQPREKKLAIGLAAAVVAWFGMPLFEGVFLSPLNDVNERLLGAKTLLETQETLQLGLLKATKALKLAKTESLPPDPVAAQRLYQEWLTDLAQLSGWTKVKSTVNQPVKSKTYFSIPIFIEAQATLAEVDRFVQHFEATSLRQRIVRLDLASPSDEGNPRLAVSLHVEGLSLPEAKPRARLFSETHLTTPMTAAGPSEVVLKDGYPGGTAAARVDQEILELVAGAADSKEAAPAGPVRVKIQQRGMWGTTVQAHAAEAIVQFWPRTDRASTDESEDFDEPLVAWKSHPFIKPRPKVEYKPRFEIPAAQYAYRGEPWTKALALTGWNPLWGKPQITLSEAPPGMKINAAGDELQWDPPVERALGECRVVVSARPEERGPRSRRPRDLPREPIRTTVAVTVRDPNHPPEIKPIEPLKIYAGQSFQATLLAEDSDPDDQLSWSLTGTPPEGMSIDRKSGQLRWTPSVDQPAGNVTVNVAVRASGIPH